MPFKFDEEELGKLDRVELENLVEKLVKEKAELQERLDSVSANDTADTVGETRFQPALHDTSSLAEAALWASGFFKAAEAAAQRFIDEARAKAEADAMEMLEKASETISAENALIDGERASIEDARKALEEDRASIGELTAAAEAAADELVSKAQETADAIIREAEESKESLLSDAREQAASLRAQAQELFAKTKAVCDSMVEQVKARLDSMD